MHLLLINATRAFLLNGRRWLQVFRDRVPRHWKRFFYLLMIRGFTSRDKTWLESPSDALGELIGGNVNLDISESAWRKSWD